MNLYVNGRTLTVNNAYPERGENGVITLFVTVPYAEMEYMDLKELFKGNTEDIIKIDGETEETYSGFTYSQITDDDANENFVVTLVSDENSFQLGRNRQLEKDNAELAATIAFKDAEITAKDSEIAELLAIAEEYADMVFAALEESEVM